MKKQIIDCSKPIDHPEHMQIVPLTEEEIAIALQPPATPTKLQQITALEATITPRRIREATLGIDNGWLSNINAQIETIRNQ